MILLDIIILLVLTKANICMVDHCLYCSPSSSNLCLQCAPFYNLSISGCNFSSFSKISKISNCKIQKIPEICLHCDDHYHLSNGFCEADCLTSCLCFTPFTCINSSNKKQPNPRILKICDKKCITCSDSGCTKCKSGYFLYSGYCNPCTLDNCKKCQSSRHCSVCDSGFFLTGGKCSRCEEGCKKCVHYSSNCFECSSGYSFSNGVCKKDRNNSMSFRGAIAGIVIGGIVFILLVTFFICRMKMRCLRLDKENDDFVPVQNPVVEQENNSPLSNEVIILDNGNNAFLQAMQMLLKII